MSRLPELPVVDILAELRVALATQGAAVLVAPPGAGKTTLVPLALLDEPWLAGARIIMLEPRRIATRAAARRMANLRGEAVGTTVGYRMRMETVVGAETRIEVVTEGVFARMVSADPTLDGIGLVILDEFHERSLHADSALALAQHSRALVRPELRLLVMSATLDALPVAKLLGDAPVVRSEGRTHPVTTRYAPPRPGQRLDAAVAQVVERALGESEGDVLVFLPGAREIHWCEELLRSRADEGVLIAPLFGDLRPAEQDRALAPAPAPLRKVVLATDIAETSLTIEGTRVVVDAGYSRVPRFSARTGMTRLETVRVSRASADQRRGRAGRTAPGVCYRLWSEVEEQHLIPQRAPEILEADLMPLALELASSGVRHPAELKWLDPPPEAAWSQAMELLAQLGAVRDGALTPLGTAMAAIPLHPRLASMVLHARDAELGAVACLLAALLSARDPLRGAGEQAPADLSLRLEALMGRGRRGQAGDAGDVAALRRIRDDAARLMKMLGVNRRDDRVPAPSAIGWMIAFAYPERIAWRRGEQGRFLLRMGRGAVLPPTDPLSNEAWLAVAELDGAGADSRIRLAAPIAGDDVLDHFREQIVVEERVEWDARASKPLAVRRERLGAITLREDRVTDADPAALASAALAELHRSGLELLPWSRSAQELVQRIRFLRSIDESWPDASEQALLAQAGEWLGDELVRVRGDVARADVEAALWSWLGWQRRRDLDRLAPTHLVVPTGSRIAIDYSRPEEPVLAVRLQEMFGLAETPAIGGGRHPLLLHLLSPAGRPVQVTRDLAGFWRGSYADVRREMRGRYPKHYWPDDPLVAEPTRSTRRR